MKTWKLLLSLIKRMNEFHFPVSMKKQFQYETFTHIHKYCSGSSCINVIMGVTPGFTFLIYASLTYVSWLNLLGAGKEETYLYYHV